jgi:hypothetical protein
MCKLLAAATLAAALAADAQTRDCFASIGDCPDGLCGSRFSQYPLLTHPYSNAGVLAMGASEIGRHSAASPQCQCHSTSALLRPYSFKPTRRSRFR